jgi:hypothetical protein
MLPQDKPPCPHCNSPNSVLVTSRPLYHSQSLADLRSGGPYATQYTFQCRCGKLFNFDLLMDDNADHQALSPNTFWLCLHELACSVRDEGHSDVERRANILERYNQMPDIAKRAVQTELWELISFLPEVNLSVRAVSRTDDQTKHNRTG